MDANYFFRHNNKTIKRKIKILIQFKLGNRWRTRFDNCNRKYGRRKQTYFRTQCIGWLVSEGVWIRWRISLHKNRNCIHNWRRSNATICSRRIKGESKYFSNLSSKISICMIWPLAMWAVINVDFIAELESSYSY